MKKKFCNRKTNSMKLLADLKGNIWSRRDGKRRDFLGGSRSQNGWKKFEGNHNRCSRVETIVVNASEIEGGKLGFSGIAFVCKCILPIDESRVNIAPLNYSRFMNLTSSIFLLSVYRIPPITLHRSRRSLSFRFLLQNPLELKRYTWNKTFIWICLRIINMLNCINFL